MPRCRARPGRHRGYEASDHIIPLHHDHHHQRRGARARRRGNISSAALRRMVLSSTSDAHQENLAILSSYYRRVEDGSAQQDGHCYWSYQRRAQLINSCHSDRGRFGLGVHTKRFLAISEIVDEFAVPRAHENWVNVIVPDMFEHSVINDDLYDDDEDV